jgi:hypothetical protein
MGTRNVPPVEALEVELAALRSRAYGARADIDGDPTALARLTQLEEWHATAGRERPGSDIAADPDAVEAMPALAGPRSFAREAGPRRPIRSPLDGARTRVVALTVGVAAATLLVAAGLYVWASPRPDAVLQLTERPPDSQATRLAGYVRHLLVDNTTLEAYEPFLGVDVYSASSALGNECLLVIEPTTDNVLGATCVPTGAEPVVYIYDVPLFGTGDWHRGLPAGSVVRFVLSGDSVTAWVYEGGGSD